MKVLLLFMLLTIICSKKINKPLSQGDGKVVQKENGHMVSKVKIVDLKEPKRKRNFEGKAISKKPKTEIQGLTGKSQRSKINRRNPKLKMKSLLKLRKAEHKRKQGNKKRKEKKNSRQSCSSEKIELTCLENAQLALLFEQKQV